MALALGEPMLLHIAATTQVVSAVLVVKRDEPDKVLKVQRPVYFVSDVIFDSKTRYPWIPNLIYAMLISKRKLKQYFYTHSITVVLKYPLKEVIQSPEVDGAEHCLRSSHYHQIPCLS
jgi:hypothetical protein